MKTSDDVPRVSTPVKKTGPSIDSIGSSEKVGNVVWGRPKRDILEVAQQTIREFAMCQPNCEKHFGLWAGKVHRRCVERLNNDFASAEHKVKDRQELLTWHRVRKQLAATVEILRVAVWLGSS